MPARSCRRKGIKIGAEHLRRNRPRTMGSIYWQLNDCWPVASWSSSTTTDAGRRCNITPGASKRRARFAPLEDGNLAVYVVSDRTPPVSGELRVRLMTFDGTVVSDKSQAVEVPALSSQTYLKVPAAELGSDIKHTFAVADLKVNGKIVSSNLLLFALPKEAHLPAAQITSELAKAGDSYRLRLSSKVLARSVSISFGDLDTKLADDYFDLLPGEPLEIRVDSAATADQLRANLKVVSLTDAFAPAK